MTGAVQPIGPASVTLRVNGKAATFRLFYYQFGSDRWIAAITGDADRGTRLPLRIESACVLGHVFHSANCDCNYQLDAALSYMIRAGRGIVVYGVDQDARGLGIAAHFQIYALRQQEGLDTDEVYRRLGRGVDERSYEPVAAILRDFGVSQVLLLSNNRARSRFLETSGFDVQLESLEAPLDFFNISTLMLEKEDLDYTWSFPTHSDWLSGIQARVTEHPNRQTACVVADNSEVLCLVEDSGEWRLAQLLEAKLPKLDNARLYIAYLTDVPRRDEIERFGAMGLRYIVLPFDRLPAWAMDAARRAQIHLHDWARRNRYRSGRPQWQLVRSTGAVEIYVRGNRARLHVTSPQGRIVLAEAADWYRRGGKVTAVDRPDASDGRPQRWFEVRTSPRDDMVAPDRWTSVPLADSSGNNIGSVSVPPS